MSDNLQTDNLQTDNLQTDNLQADNLQADNLQADNSQSNNLQELSDEQLRFQSRFTDQMEMYGDKETVIDYLDCHQDWFCHCAKPMVAEPLGSDGYALSLGSFSALGHTLEPQMGLELISQPGGIYRITTVPVPGYTAIGYDVDFKANLTLVETELEPGAAAKLLTTADWDLDLTVYVQLPGFLQVLPRKLIEHTGDRVLCQIVRQISRRLTHRVQADFHTKQGLPIPKRR
jgi:hypothetical protein